MLRPAMLLLALSIPSCAHTPDNTARPAAASVAASMTALAGVGHVITACYTVPRCASVAPKAKIKVAFDAAYKDVTAAQEVADTGGSPNMVATFASMAALQSIVDQLPVTAK